MTRIIQLSQLDAAPELRALVSGGAVSIGNFDGVHRGHASLLQQTHRLAGQVDGPAVAVILDPHPAEILRPDRAPPRLTWVERRAELMTQHGIDALIVCETTPAFLKRTAAEFFETLVVATLNAAAMVEGPNFFFGRDRGGNVDVLTGLCEQRGIKLHVVQPSEADSQIISSTRIRQVLQRGAVAEATDLLGCPYRIRGTVERGAGRGKKIGFPTANLEQIDVLVPGLGVYAGVVQIGGNSYPAAIHIGPNPTFEDDQHIKVEVHVLDFDGDLYGDLLLLDFVSRVRDIARFDSPDELVAQLGRDIQSVRNQINSSCHGQD